MLALSVLLQCSQPRRETVEVQAF